MWTTSFTVNVALSDESSCVGGELAMGSSGVQAIRRGEGEATVHSSTLLHAVSRLDSGTRYALIVFIGEAEARVPMELRCVREEEAAALAALMADPLVAEAAAALGEERARAMRRQYAEVVVEEEVGLRIEETVQLYAAPHLKPTSCLQAIDGDGKSACWSSVASLIRYLRESAAPSGGGSERRRRRCYLRTRGAATTIAAALSRTSGGGGGGGGGGGEEGGRRPSHARAERTAPLTIARALLMLLGGVSPGQSTWAIVSGSQWCSITSNGACVTDGAGTHGNNERCTIRAQQSFYATATYFNTETYWDYISIASRRWSGSTGPVNIAMSAGATMTWYTDGSVNYGGFEICATTNPYVFPPPPPPPSPPPSPQRP